MSLLRLLNSRKPSYVHLTEDGCPSTNTDKGEGRYNPKEKEMGCIRTTLAKLLMLPLIGVIALMVASHVLAAKTSEPSALYECINDGPSQQLTTYKDFAYQRPARMKLEKAFWSAREPAVQVTIVTGLNPSRLNQLESQCRSYRGPISAAVYVVLYNPDKGELTREHKQELQEAVDKAGEFHNRMESNNYCQLDIMILYETVADDVMQVMFPINTMRNYALLQARTRLVAMVDVDLIVSNTLLQWLEVAKNYEALKVLTSTKTVLVLPAFETAPQKNLTLAHELADTAAMMSKVQLHQLVDRKLVYQFALYLFRQGHNCTDYKKWFSNDEPYDIYPAEDYEPWFIIDRFQNPFYDASFRGYGWNKVSHVLNIKYSNYKFIAHPAGFLIHRQHSRSDADKMYQAQKKNYERDVALKKVTKEHPNNNLAGLTHRFRDQVLADVAAGTYKPLIDDGIKNCVKLLPWWKKQGDLKRFSLRRFSLRRLSLRRLLFR